jgi:hypothetical protein
MNTMLCGIVTHYRSALDQQGVKLTFEKSRTKIIVINVERLGMSIRKT